MNYPPNYNLPPGVTDRMIDEHNIPTLVKKPSRYSYNVPRQAITILRDTMIAGKVKHPKNDGWKRSTGYHVWRAMKHLLWYALTWQIYHLEHAFTRLMMALGVRNGWK